MSTKYQAVFDAYKTEFKRVNGREVITLEEIPGSRGWCLLQTQGDMPKTKVRINVLKQATERFKVRSDFKKEVVNNNDILSPMPAVNPRRPYDDEKPEGYLESLDDWIDNNKEAIEWFLENAEKIRAVLNKHA